jgi:hypothetical protein
MPAMARRGLVPQTGKRLDLIRRSLEEKITTKTRDENLFGSERDYWVYFCRLASRIETRNQRHPY